MHHPPKKYIAPALIGVIRETARNLQHVEVMINVTTVGEDFLYQVTTLSGSKAAKTATERYIEKLSRRPEDLGITIPIMCKVFPFHIVLDREMQIVQLGRGLLRIFKYNIKEGDRHFSSFFHIKSPKVSLSFHSIAQLSNVPFVLIIKIVHRTSETLQVSEVFIVFNHYMKFVILGLDLQCYQLLLVFY